MTKTQAKIKRKPEKVDKREILLKSAIVLFEANGFWNTSTAQIAKHAGVATGTLFNYFPSKENLLDEIFIHIRKQLLSQLITENNEDFMINFKYLFETYTNWCLQNSTEYALLSQLKVLKMVSKKTEVYVEKDYEIFTNRVNEQLQKDGLFHPTSLAYAMTLINYQLEANIEYINNQNLTGDALKQQNEFAFSRLVASLIK